MEQVHAIFTENLVTSHAASCDRITCEVIIPPGQHRFYIRNARDKHNLAGKYVCKSCFLYYREQVSQTVPASMHHGQVDTDSIRRDVNESQRRGAHTPEGRVTVMPPPATFRHGPVAGISSTRPWNNSTPTQETTQWAPSPAAFGYSAAHTHHGQQTQEWSQRAYKGILGCSSGKTISINIEVYQPDVDSKGNPIRLPQIKEGIHVPYNIMDVQLLQRIREAVQLPLLEYVRKIPIDINSMVVRETTGGMWTRIHPDEGRATPYFGERFMVGPRKKSDHAPVFSAPKKPLLFGIVMPADVWTKIQQREEIEYLEKLNGGRPEVQQPILALGEYAQSQSKTLKRKGDEKKEGKGKQRQKTPPSGDSDSDSSDASTEYIASAHTRQYKKRTLQQTYQASPPPPAAPATHATAPVQQSKPKLSSESEEIGMTVARAIVVKSGSRSPATSSATISLSKSVTQGLSVRKVSQSQPRSTTSKIRSSRRSLTSGPQLAYRPLDAQSIRRGFQEGGASSKKKDLTENAIPFVSERILFFPLPQLTFEELIWNPGQAIFITIQPGSHFNGNLAYNPKDTLGKGSFKTAIHASLEFDGTRTPSTGLGSITINNASTVSVALKRPFVQVQGPQQSKLRPKLGSKLQESRLAYADEQHAITGEAKLLVWGNALLNFAYAFIFDFISRSGQEDSLPPYIDDMPTFRFVQAGVAIVLKEVEKSKAPSSHRAVYLLEEMLPGTTADFTKYINNSEAAPLLEHNEPDFDLAVFLTFIQHVQYQITHKQAYVSDFQGVSTTLTDPQIMTSPALGPNLFGDGNLGEAFERFPAEHVCNDYCQWFKLETLA